MKKKIAIIGAGVAGLTLANFLKRDGKHEFKVYEKAESLSLDEGYGIQLAKNSIKILNLIGFNKIDNKSIYNPNRLDFFSNKKKKICDLNLSQFNSNDAHYTTLKRSILIEFLKDDVYNQYLKFGKVIKEVSETKGKILLKFEDATNDLVDYVVGADGIFSNTRSFFEKKKNQPKFKKVIAIRSILKSKSSLDINEKNISILMGSNSHIVIYPVNKINELNLVCILRNDKYDPNNIKKIIEKKIISQNTNLAKIFDGEFKSWPLYSTPKILPSSNRKVFYIGDACNGFLPTLAQGANQSIESAFELFNLIKDNKLEQQNNYFDERSKRIKIVRKRSNLNLFLFHLSSPITQSARNFFMRTLIKREKFLNSYLGTVYKD